MDYDAQIKKFVTKEHYDTMKKEYGVKSLNDLHPKMIDIILFEIHRMNDGMK